MRLSILSALLIASAAVSEEVSIGCFKYPEVLHGAVGEWGGIFGVDCREVCAANGTIFTYEYSRWRGGPGVDIYCVCNDSPPDADLNTPHYQDCVPGFTSPGDVAVWADAPGWHEVGCFPVGLPPGQAGFTDFFACANHCLSHRYSIQVYLDYDPNVYCQCRDNDDPWSGMEPSLNCAQGDWKVYSNTAQPSSFVKRQEKQKQLKAQDGHSALCPEHLNACMISDEPGSGFECLDIQEELESCGGCRYGEYGSQAEHLQPSPVGIDCSQLPNVAPDGVTCTKGRCHIFSCARGYSLKDKRCELSPHA
ncbi:hypothetical protein IAT40_007256 [Kwoniella sp. CBS 6097]